MIRIIFITILFLSSNLFAATYLLCENDEHSHQIKLGNKKIYIRYSNTEEFINYSNNIVKWSDEIIITERKITYDEDMYLDKCYHTYYYMKENNIQKEEDIDVFGQIVISKYQRENHSSLLDKAILLLCEEKYIEIEKDKKIQKIMIDRLIGELNIESPYSYLPTGNYNCEVRKKTLF